MAAAHRRWINSVACSFLACAIAIVIEIALLLTSGTPHNRTLQIMFELNSYRGNSDAPAAGQLFDEFLRTGEHAEILNSTVVPALSASAVIMATRLWLTVGTAQVILVILGYAAFRGVRTGFDLGIWDIVDVFVFAVVLIAGFLLLREKTTPNRV